VSVSKELSAIPSLYFVGEVFGSVDFVLAGLVTDFDDVERLTDAITSIDGVTNVTVDINYEVLKYLHRYGRLNQQPIEVILPNPRVDVDELDRRIASSLIVDGRTSNRALARRFDCSEGTIRTRIRRMESDGLLKIRAQVDPFLSGELIALAYVGLCVEGDLGSKLIDQLVAMPAVYSLWRTSGRYQLVASVGAGNRGELVRAIKDDIQSLEGVRSLSTWEIARFVKMSSYLARLSLVDANTNENLT
jgi:DNA-binding Lrp family transcriptional regulator